MMLAQDLRLVAAAVLLAAIALGLVLHTRRRRRAAEALGDDHLVRRLVGLDLRRPPWLRMALVLAGAAALAGALLDPSLTAAPPRPAGPVVLLLDASGSMLADDLGDRRIDVQRDIAQRLAEALTDVPVGIVAFSGDAFALTPPTRDRRAVGMYLETLDPTIVSQTGSGLGDAIRQGLALLAAADDPAGALVLVTDGDETEDREAALEAAALAGRAGVLVHVVGVGTEDGAPVPAVDLAAGTAEGFLRDEAGQPLISRMDVDLLRSIADGAGGFFVQAAGGDPVPTLVERLTPSRPAAGPPGDVPRYAWLAATAFLLLLMEPFAQRRSDPA